MASLFASRPQTPKARLVPNGGLGGVVCPAADSKIAENLQIQEVAGKSKSKPQLRQRPPPLRISSRQEALTISPSQISATSSLGFSGLWSPKTPADRDGCNSLPQVAVDAGPSPITPRFRSAVPSDWYFSLPETPISISFTHKQLQHSLSAAELPGSLLLPSQGFPQTNPISPPPSHRLSRRDTEESVLSQATTLPTTPSNDDATMDAFRNLTTPLRKHRRSQDSAMPSYTIGQPTPLESQVTKPFSAMNIEELLDTLPDCDASAISLLWLPAARDQFQKMVALLNEAGEMKIASSIDQITLNKDLKDFSDEIRMITAAYRKAVESAESLAERDTRTYHARVRELETQLNGSAEGMRATEEELEEQTRKNGELRHTIHELSRVLGTFVQSNIPSWIETINEPRTQQVLQIITDFTRNGETSQFPFVIVPEDVLDQRVQELQDARSLAVEYRRVLHGQGAMIKDQSKNLDEYADKYERVIKLVQERDHEILLLVQRHEDLTVELDACHTELAEIQDFRAEAETLAHRYEELRGTMESLKTAHVLEMDQRDAEILNLRQKLGSAREEVIARREDVKNIMSRSQAALQGTMPAPPPTATINKNSNASKALRFFGMDRGDKDRLFKRGATPGIPISYSAIGLSRPHVDERYSSKEVALDTGIAGSNGRPTRSNPSSLQIPAHQRSQTSPNTPVDSSKGSTDSVMTFPPTRPRSDSLGAMIQHPRQSHALAPSPVDTHKSLPDPPLVGSRQFGLPSAASAARLGEIIQEHRGRMDDTSPLEAQIAADYFKNGIIGQTAARRVLSNIPEMGTTTQHGPVSDEYYDDDNESLQSVASSDREVYRKSICAYDMLNSSAGLPYSETETDLERVLRTRAGPPRNSVDRRTAGIRSAVGEYYQDEEGDNGEGHDDGEDHEEPVQAGLARVLHLRPGNRDLRARAVGIERHGGSGDERVKRHSMLSDGSGYRTEDSEPKTVAQLYHQSRRHIRG